MKHTLQRVLALAMSAILLTVSNAHASGGVIVNRVAISADDQAALEWYYGGPLKDGSYWYDRVSGLWGPEGGPTAGQILAGLNLGGQMRSDASGGNTTGVFFNGRQLHPSEVQYLRNLFGTVYPGRYWLGPDLIGGAEGGPAFFTLNTQTSNRRAAPGGDISTNHFGTWSSDGNCFFVAVEGGSVMGSGC